MKQPDRKIVVTIGEHDVAVHTDGRLAYTTGRILGREISPQGVEQIWVDRLIAPYGTELGDGWTAYGAVSTILTRCVEMPEAACLVDA